MQVLEEVSRVAPLNKPVLIVGERGTGKELVAARTHYLSNRWEATYLKMNCAAISDSLLESELFGHEAGAFTGAVKARPGRFERASGGTLFMDELATTSTLVQEKILRVIEYGEFERIGGTKTLSADVRLVAATNEDLPRLADEGRFRADLLDRLAFDVITLPPLRHRQEDIPLLANHFAINMATELGLELFTGFSARAVEQLMEHRWPGNIRELKNAVERAVYRAADDDLIDEIVLDPFESPYRPAPTTQSTTMPDQTGASPARPSPTAEHGADSAESEAATASVAQTQEPQAPDIEFPLALKEHIKVIEVDLLNQAMDQAKHNQRKAATLLGLSYHQLRGYLKKYELIGPGSDSAD